MDRQSQACVVLARLFIALRQTRTRTIWWPPENHPLHCNVCETNGDPSLERTTRKILPEMLSDHVRMLPTHIRRQIIVRKLILHGDDCRHQHERDRLCLMPDRCSDKAPEARRVIVSQPFCSDAGRPALVCVCPDPAGTFRA